jgi:hypothetical protein
MRGFLLVALCAPAALSCSSKAELGAPCKKTEECESYAMCKRGACRDEVGRQCRSLCGGFMIGTPARSRIPWRKLCAEGCAPGQRENGTPHKAASKVAIKMFATQCKAKTLGERFCGHFDRWVRRQTRWPGSREPDSR